VAALRTWRLCSGICAICAAALAIPSVITAHAFLATAAPAEDSTVTSAPKEVRLAFTEPVETRFSIFKVYRLDMDPVVETQRLNAAAGALVSDVLQKRGDEAARADAGLATTTRTSSDIVIGLKPDPRPGAYVVMWRVLSIDTHTTQGFFVFVFAPAR
jgi:methionine-rich copper-binding protein CopC